jgi:hypothetical protein
MILEYGNVSKLQNEPWYMMELRSEKTIEPTMRRLGKAISSIFRSDPIEIFIPVFKRDLDVFELKTGPYIFVRSTNFNSLLRLKTITGVVSLVTEGDSNRPNKAISVEDAYVQSIIKEAEEEFRNRGVGIEVGSFVRILNGETRDFCGTVEVIGDGKAIVRITLRTKSVLLETPIRNLLNLSHIPKEQRVYYYSALVKDLVEEGGIGLIKEDLQLEESMATIEAAMEEQQTSEPRRHSRQRTVTALVKKMVLIDNEHDPMVIARAVIKALKTDEIKAPKNLFIVYCIIKDTLMRQYFKKIDPELSNYREVIKKYGTKFKFSANKIAKIDRSVKIPVLTEDVCLDGRSKEARRRKEMEPAHNKKAKKLSKVVEKVPRRHRISEKHKAKLLAGRKRAREAKKRK